MRKIIGIVGLLLCPSVFSASSSLHLDWLNPAISPEKDFYSYANGTWQKNNPIPSDYSSWGSFHILNEKVQKIIHQLLIDAAKNSHAEIGGLEQKVGDFYYSGMDEAQINQAGVKPLQTEFERIQNIKNLNDLLNVTAHLHQIGVGVLFNFGSMQDFKNSEQMIGAVAQGGLGLPDRDYYLKDDEKFKKIRTSYVQHIARVFELLGIASDIAATNAEKVMRIETQMATASMSQEEQRDPYAIYHMMSVAYLDKTTANLSWSRYLSAMGQGQLQQINWMMPEFFKTLNQMLATTTIDDWKLYIQWHVVDAFASYLSQPFVDEDFKMNQALTGVETQLPRWKRVVQTENGALGFAIGKIYVARYFSEQSKQDVLNILNNIRKQLRKEITTLSWMTPETRKAAMKKLDLMEERVGYPDKWRDYSSLTIDRKSYVLNVIRSNEFLVKRDLNKIGKPIDRTEWAMTPQTVNAYYDPSMNSINIPAGILQAPFFDVNAPMAVNYGAIGFVIGHEITHGFDDQGAKFDGQGNLKDWWTSRDKKQFKAATQCISDQYSQYIVDGNLHVKGPLVVGEATADLGGITLAYRAFRASPDYTKAKTLDGFTPDQQFFLGTAFVWAVNIRPEQIRNQVTIDPHPPAQYRVNGSLANIPEFKAAFKIPDQSPMVNSKQCVIW